MVKVSKAKTVRCHLDEEGERWFRCFKGRKFLVKYAFHSLWLMFEGKNALSTALIRVTEPGSPHRYGSIQWCLIKFGTCTCRIRSCKVPNIYLRDCRTEWVCFIWSNVKDTRSISFSTITFLICKLYYNMFICSSTMNFCDRLYPSLSFLFFCILDENRNVPKNIYHIFQSTRRTSLKKDSILKWC